MASKGYVSDRSLTRQAKKKILVLGIVKASLEILGIGIGVKKSGIAHVCPRPVPGQPRVKEYLLGFLK